MEELPIPSHPYASGGGGTVLEHRFGAVLLTHVLTGVPLPAFGADVTPAEVIFQAPGTKVDDFLVRGSTKAGIQRELAIAVRRRPTLKPSDAPSVKLFRSFLGELRQYQDDLKLGHRRLALALEGPASLARDLTELANCARAQPNGQAFRDHVATRRARTLRERLQRLDQMVKAASEDTGTIDDQTWRLLSGLYVVELRLQEGKDSDRADAVFRLSHQITDSDLDEASRCFDRILDLARDFAPEGAWVNQAMLAARLGLTLRAANGEALEEYIRRFLTHREPDPAAAVPLTITTASGTALLSDTAAAHLEAAQHVHIIAPSGAGKTVALAQIAAQLAHEDKLPIWLTARSYGQHGLGVLLDAAVAPYSVREARELMQGAATLRKPVVLLVDGLNECPSDLQKELLDELNALCLREPVTVVTTGQNHCNAPEPLAGTMWSIEPPSPDQRDHILAAHGADASDSAFALFRHPLELALAARLHGDLPARAGTGILLDAYVRMRLSRTATPAAARAVLRAWARAMDQQFRSTLSLGEAERLASRVDGADIHDAFACGLVEVEGQHFAFAHERFQRLLAAEAIVLDHLDDPTVLARELQAPSRADLVALAATFAPDIEAVQAIMEAAPESNMFTDALQGRLGPVPEQFMDREARRLLSHATSVMATCSLHFETDFQLAITPASAWSAYETAVFAAVGAVLHDGVLLRETMQLLDATDTTLASATAAEPQTIAHHIGSALVGIYGSDSGVLPASLVLEACRLTFNRFDSTVTAQQFALLSHGLDPTRYSRIYLVCLLASRSGLFDAATYVLPAAKCAWESGVYHLQLAIFDMLMFLRHNVSPSERTAIEDFLQSLQTSHLFLADALTECLAAYDLISLPFTAEDITIEIEQLLEAPDTAETTAAAYRVYTRQLEPVIGPPYFEAIEALEPAKRARLAALAGRYTEALVWKPLILRELLEATDPAAIPAFELWAASLAENMMQPQDDIAAYVISVLGLAGHMQPLPPSTNLHGPVGEAWACYGQILWHTHHPDLTNEEVADRCRPQWQRLLHELNNHATEPLFWISDTHQAPVTNALHNILDRFPEEARAILESGITQPERQLQLTRWPNQLAHVRRYIQLLTRVGNQASQRLLAAMAHDPDFGHDAATAARQLSDHLGINVADDQ